MRGQVWFTEEEVLLALDTYMRVKSKQLSRNTPEIQYLSQVLKELPIHSEELKDASFRSPDGVRGRVGVFRRLAAGNARNAPKLYREVWAKYGHDSHGLRARIARIVEKYGIDP